MATSITVPTTEPTQAVAGETWTWQRSLADYLASAGWTLTYYLVPNAGGTRITLTTTAAADGSSHLVEKAAATTAGYAAGHYYWQAFVSKAGEKYLVDRGRLEVLADLSAVATDQRTHARKVFDALKSVVEGRSDKDSRRVEINGKRLERMSWDELMGAYEHFGRLVALEEEQEGDADANAAAESRTLRYSFRSPAE